jgi:heterogeneous nuclear ribonucleoprotein U-like protein 1
MSEPLVPSKLSVDELREELRARGLQTSGLKPALLERLQEALAAPGAAQTRLALAGAGGTESSDGEREKKHRGGGGGGGSGRGSHKKEPQREEFPDQESYEAAWARWRDARDSNNASVKRSRELAKKKRSEQERLHQEREQQNAELEKLVFAMKEEVRSVETVNTEQSKSAARLQQPESLCREEEEGLKRRRMA